MYVQGNPICMKIHENSCFPHGTIFIQFRYAQRTTEGVQSKFQFKKSVLEPAIGFLVISCRKLNAVYVFKATSQQEYWLHSQICTFQMKIWAFFVPVKETINLSPSTTKRDESQSFVMECLAVLGRPAGWSIDRPIHADSHCYSYSSYYSCCN